MQEDRAEYIKFILTVALAKVNQFAPKPVKETFIAKRAALTLGAITAEAFIKEVEKIFEIVSDTEEKAAASLLWWPEL